MSSVEGSLRESSLAGKPMREVIELDRFAQLYKEEDPNELMAESAMERAQKADQELSLALRDYPPPSPSSGPSTRADESRSCAEDSHSRTITETIAENITETTIAEIIAESEEQFIERCRRRQISTAILVAEAGMTVLSEPVIPSEGSEDQCDVRSESARSSQRRASVRRISRSMLRILSTFGSTAELSSTVSASNSRRVSMAELSTRSAVSRSKVTSSPSSISYQHARPPVASAPKDWLSRSTTVAPRRSRLPSLVLLLQLRRRVRQQKK